jgi:hypothetical protein
MKLAMHKQLACVAVLCPLLPFLGAGFLTLDTVNWLGPTYDAFMIAGPFLMLLSLCLGRSEWRAFKITFLVAYAVLATLVAIA